MLKNFTVSICLLALLLFNFVPVSQILQAQTSSGGQDGKFALLIGIDKYEYTTPLYGAVADARVMRECF